MCLDSTISLLIDERKFLPACKRDKLRRSHSGKYDDQEAIVFKISLLYIQFRIRIKFLNFCHNNRVW